MANKPIGSVFLLRSLLILFLLNVALIQAGYRDNNMHSAYGEHDLVLTLELLNTVRSSVTPPASNMRYMVRSSKLTDEARKLASECNDTTVPKPGVLIQHKGHEDFYKFTKRILDDGTDAMRNGQCDKDNQTCRFYRDLMDADSDSIGCAMEWHTSSLSWCLVCVTNAKRSEEPFDGLFYNNGTPCQMCPESSGYCYRNLCVSHATKTAIQQRTPTSVITCDAPCLNCGERKDVGNTCSCQCPTGYTSKVDCSEGSGKLTCSTCGMDEMPCRNGGRKAGSDRTSYPCSCRCGEDYVGQFCETPIAKIVGGVVVRLVEFSWRGLEPFSDNNFTIWTADRLQANGGGVSRFLAQQIDKFCQSNPTNYLQCCGYGTLPDNGPIDFVDSVVIDVKNPVRHPDRHEAEATFHATAKGNNGLCRKQTATPPPILAVPPDVLKKVLERFLNQNLFNNVKVTEVLGYYAHYYNVSTTMSYLSVKIG